MADSVVCVFSDFCQFCQPRTDDNVLWVTDCGGDILSPLGFKAKFKFNGGVDESFWSVLEGFWLIYVTIMVQPTRLNNDVKFLNQTCVDASS